MTPSRLLRTVEIFGQLTVISASCPKVTFLDFMMSIIRSFLSDRLILANWWVYLHAPENIRVWSVTLFGDDNNLWPYPLPILFSFGLSFPWFHLSPGFHIPFVRSTSFFRNRVHVCFADNFSCPPCLLHFLDSWAPFFCSVDLWCSFLIWWPLLTHLLRH